MRPWESSQTPCVLPYWMLAGSSPQSWIASYLWSPSPSTGRLVPTLSVAPRMSGEHPPTANRNVRRFMKPIVRLRGGLIAEKHQEQRFLGVQAILGLVEHDGALRFHNAVGDFFPSLCREAMHKARIGPRLGE